MLVCYLFERDQNYNPVGETYIRPWLSEQISNNVYWSIIINGMRVKLIGVNEGQVQYGSVISRLII